ncbi:multidrug effflux MFS transporter [Falsirhodobacter sp. alg1]|uniref:multidrug effflux MFS transporter n=1 Tax=Falsirhodobacter sp. alg1 TaxID=1472418 RepID=UPI0009EB070F|nr:multidrug effflux MFS transporter [Falsirhodobacter sp. alg1]
MPDQDKAVDPVCPPSPAGLHDSTTAPAPPRISKVEFVCMMATMMAIVAFSTDATLPAFPQMAAALSPDAPNLVQLVVTFFLLGMGLGTIVTGPMSDHWGRKPVLLGGAALYITGAVMCWASGSLEVLLAGRILQGLGAAATRAVTVAMVRDLYSGRQMAQITSFTMMVFTLFPAIAPTFGEAVIRIAGWREIFLSLIVIAIVAAIWLSVRQGETLPPARRVPFRMGNILAGAKEILSMRVVRIMIFVQLAAFGTLFAMLSSIQQIFDISFDRASEFHLWFAGIAILSGSSGAINGMVVQRMGMRFMIALMLRLQIALSALAILLIGSGMLGVNAQFAVFVLYALGVFFQIGLLAGNATALAMEPLGHRAGLAASVMGSIGTVGAVIIAIPIGAAFNGTPLPLMIGSLTLASLSFIATRFLPGPDRETAA